MSDFRNKDEAAGASADEGEAGQLGRRSVLVRAATALIAASSASFDKPALADTAASDDDLLSFVNLSAALTGVPNVSLLPNVDPIDLKREYFKFIQQQKETEPFAALFKLAPPKKGPMTDAELADIRGKVAAAVKANDKVKYLTRSITLLWYLGGWYVPSALQAHEQSQGKTRPGFQVVSANAYTHGWIWRLARAHPMGYSDMQFGYWKEDPASLDTFIRGKIQ
jgi:D-sorbitol dehydrogenase-like protein